MRRRPKKRLKRFHRSLDGDGPQPFEQFIGRLCEEFHCLPDAAWRCWLKMPAGFMERVIEYRAYAGTKAQYDHASNPKAESPMLSLVKEIDFEIAQEDINSRG